MRNAGVNAGIATHPQHGPFQLNSWDYTVIFLVKPGDLLKLHHSIKGEGLDIFDIDQKLTQRGRTPAFALAACRRSGTEEFVILPNNAEI